MGFTFLSPEWLDAANEVRDRLGKELPPVEIELSANLIVTRSPFGEDGVIRARLDSSSGRVRFASGAFDEPDVVVRLDYAAARALMVEQDQIAVVDAFKDGRIQVEGDLEKLRTLSSINHGQAAVPDVLATQLRVITEYPKVDPPKPERVDTPEPEPVRAPEE